MYSIVIRCDIPDCGSFYDSRTEATVDAARAYAADRYGWTHRDGRDACRGHEKTP